MVNRLMIRVQSQVNEKKDNFFWWMVLEQLDIQKEKNKLQIMLHTHKQKLTKNGS